MIPWHMPPFGLGRVLVSLFDWRGRFSPQRLEEAYATALGVPHAILLPSARAGISWALRATADSGTPVLCPAFTCWVVHEAVVRSGATTRLLDAVPGEFLMDPAAVENVSPGKYAVVLSELYGHTYDLSRFVKIGGTAPALRIVDMAMTVPTRSLLDRLCGTDFGVLSFGIGKCLYAGWGGMGLTKDAALAEKVRATRDSLLARGSVLLSCKRIVRVLLRTAVHTLNLYAIGKRLHGKAADPAVEVLPSDRVSERWTAGEYASAYWTLPSSYMDRRLVYHNAQQMDRHARHRIALAERYQKNLKGIPGIAQPPSSMHPLSHYTIRVPAAARGALQSRLWRKGVTTGRLFRFPRYLSSEEFPHAVLLASEVLNLPINIHLSLDDIDHISNCVADCAAESA